MNVMVRCCVFFVVHSVFMEHGLSYCTLNDTTRHYELVANSVCIHWIKLYLLQCYFVHAFAGVNIWLVLQFRYVPFTVRTAPSLHLFSTQHRLTETPTHTAWTRASWIILEVVRCLYAYMAYNLIKPWTLAYIFILRQVCRVTNFVIV